MCQQLKKISRCSFSALTLLAFVCAGNMFAYAPNTSYEIDQLLKQKEFQGTAFIAQKGKILFAQAYGMANEEHQIGNTLETVHRIGSISKQFAAVAILQLQEKNLLNVRDPIAKYLSDYPQGDKITIHHLLSHTSGVPSITDFEILPEIQRHPSNPKQVMAYFQHLPLEFEPGTNCKYSDSGYIVLGAIIEAVAGQSYEDYIQENFFAPLDMKSTYFAHNHLIIPHQAAGYCLDAKGYKGHAAYIDMSFPHAAGALASTAEDLYKWDRALQGTTLLSLESRQALFTIQGSSQENQISYGYGFFIGPNNEELDKAGKDLIGHYGTIEGFRAASYRNSDSDVTVILLSNLENTDINSIYVEVAHLVQDSSWRPCATL